MNIFFKTSQSVYKQITEVFDFIWPTAASLWNLRWQVQGYMQVRPEASVIELNNRFVIGCGIHGANIKHACTKLTWEQQQVELSKFLLINILSLYEAWSQGILEELQLVSQERIKHLQFPTKTMPSGVRKGIWAVIDEITLSESTMIKVIFYPNLLMHRKNSKSHLDNLLTCFRYFKECRNCFVHNGGIADDKLEKAFIEFSAITDPSDLDITEIPKHDIITKNLPFSMHLRGVVGLCDVVLRLVATIDAEFARSVHAEKVFIKYWRDVHKLSRIYTLKSKNNLKIEQIRRLIKKLGLPKPQSTIELEEFLLKNRLVSR